MAWEKCQMPAAKFKCSSEQIRTSFILQVSVYSLTWTCEWAAKVSSTAVVIWYPLPWDVICASVAPSRLNCRLPVNTASESITMWWYSVNLTNAWHVWTFSGKSDILRQMQHRNTFAAFLLVTYATHSGMGKRSNKSAPPAHRAIHSVLVRNWSRGGSIFASSVLGPNNVAPEW